jgi:5'-3' exonuclease
MNRFEHFCDPFAPGFGIINSFQESLIFQKLPGGQVFVSTEFLRQITDQSLQFFPFFLGIDAFDEYGLWPQNFINYKTLMGDTSDNLPGVKGLGPKKLFKLFPELAGDSKITLKEIISKSLEKHEENGLYGNVYNFRKQLEINEQLMSLENPNIPDYDIKKLEEIIKIEPYQFNQARFLQLHSSDLLERQISPNIEFWLSNNFLYLTKYEHKK